MKISPEKFYNLFLKETSKFDNSIDWAENRKWTRKMLSGKDCTLARIAKKLDLNYYHEYFSLDGIFYKKEIDYQKLGYVQNIEVIIEHENFYRTIEKEIYKLFPLFFAPLKVIITYLDGDNIQRKREVRRIKKVIEDRIKNDDPFKLHQNKIKTLLILGSLDKDSSGKDKTNWQAFVYNNRKFKNI
jgi:hypothetical protein